ncbi:MAG: sulfite exporter TauE/SafE family protein, partial [Mariprofundus sp.]
LCGMGMALVAVLANVLFESEWQQVLAGHLPFLMAFWLGIVIILPLSSSWAARLHTSVAEQTLRLALKSLFICLSVGLLIAAVLV